MDLTKCLLVFVRCPERGRVKSRLAASLGRERVLALYKNFVLDLMDVVKEGPYCIRIYYDPPNADQSTLRAWLGEGSYSPQTGRGLGERMKNTFAEVFSEGCEKAVLIGSDVPDLPGALIDRAFTALEDHDAVIGPATDGGYYLIGFRRDGFLPHAFEGIPWGTDSVLGETMALFLKSGCRVHSLDVWSDVDTIRDLRSLYARNRETDFRKSRTMAFIGDAIREITDGDGG